MKTLKTILAAALLLLAILGTSLYVISVKYEKIVSNLIVEQLNDLLITEIKVSSIDVSPWAELPYVSLGFKDVFVADPGKVEDTLLYASKLYFHFNALDLLKDDYRIKRIALEGANAKIRRNRSGDYNFKIWKSTGDTSGLIQLNSVKLENSKITYIDPRSKVDLEYFCESIMLKLEISEAQYDLDLYGKLKSIKTRVSGKEYLPDRALRLDLGMIVTGEPSQVSFHRASLNINKSLTMGVNGVIGENKLDLILRSQNSKVKSLVELIPFDFISDLSKYQPEGKTDVELRFSETEDKARKLRVDLKLLLKGTKLSIPESKKELELEYLSAVFSNGKKANPEDSRLSVDSAMIRSENSTASFKLFLKDFDRPKVNLAAKGSIDLLEWIKTDSLDLGINSGKYEGHLSVVFRYSDSLSINDFANAQTRVKGQVFDLEFNQAQNKISLDSVELEIERNHILISSTKLQVNKDKNISINLLYRDGLKLLADDSKAGEINAELSCATFDLDQLLSNMDDEGESQLSLPLIKGKFDCGELKFMETNFSSSSAELKLQYPYLKISKAKFQHSSGQVWSDLQLKFGNVFNELSVYVDFKGIQIEELFENFNNFDQDVLISENLSGLCSGELNLDMQFDKAFEPISPSIRSVISLSVYKGKLKEFEPLQAVADYFDSNIILRKMFKANELRSELKNIAFDTLRNDFFIRNEEVYMPDMIISSSLIDIQAEGTYKFDHRLDFSLDFYITDLLARKSKVDEYGNEIIDDGTGRKRVFLKMEGEADDPDFSIDKEKRKAYRQGIVSSEKEELKNILKEEIKILKSDSLRSLDVEKEESKEIELIWDPEEESRE